MCLLCQTKISFFILLLLSHYIQAQDIEISHLNSTIEFEVSHLSVLSVKGTFEEFSGILLVKGDSLIVSGSIKTRSINTKNDSRDETLRSEPYLDIDNYPEILYEGMGEQTSSGFLVSGTLSLKNLKTDVSFELIQDKGVFKSREIILSRKRMGLSFDSMDLLIGDEIRVTLMIENPSEY